MLFDRLDSYGFAGMVALVQWFGLCGLRSLQQHVAFGTSVHTERSELAIFEQADAGPPLRLSRHDVDDFDYLFCSMSVGSAFTFCHPPQRRLHHFR